MYTTAPPASRAALSYQSVIIALVFGTAVTHLHALICLLLLDPRPPTRLSLCYPHGASRNAATSRLTRRLAHASTAETNSLSSRPPECLQPGQCLCKTAPRELALSKESHTPSETTHPGVSPSWSLSTRLARSKRQHTP
jgi:hypothetical protein